MRIEYRSIPQLYADRIRATRVDDFGHIVEASLAGETGYGPCRCCLKQFKPEESRLLFSYAPVKSDNPYNEVGPVYIHEECEAYPDVSVFPPEVKNGRLPIRLVLRGYNEKKRMILARFVKDNHEIEKEIAALLEDPRVALVHVRNATYQCFIASATRFQGTGS